MLSVFKKLKDSTRAKTAGGHGGGHDGHRGGCGTHGHGEAHTDHDHGAATDAAPSGASPSHAAGEHDHHRGA